MTIIITGSGRSGTSFLASLYKALSFDPGGSWSSDNNAGYEAPEAVIKNQELLREMKVTAFGPPRDYRTLSDVVGDRAAARIKERIPRRARRAARTAVDRLPGRAARSLELLPHSRLRTVSAKHAEELRSIAESYEVMKDPLFGWTLPLWLEAAADISHVIVATRQTDQAVGSHSSAGHMRFRDSDDAFNSLIFSLGLVISSCLDRGVPFTIVRFPDMISNPTRLYRDLVFPRPVSEAQFLSVFEQTVYPSAVHRYGGLS